MRRNSSLLILARLRIGGGSYFTSPSGVINQFETTDASGALLFPLPIPSDLSLRGAEVDSQVLGFEGPELRAVMSNAGSTKIQRF